MFGTLCCHELNALQPFVSGQYCTTVLQFIWVDGAIPPGANCHPQHNTNCCNDYVDKLKEWGFLDHDVVSNPPVNFPGAATTKHYQPHNIEPSSSQTQPLPMSKGVVLAMIYESVKVEADHLHMVLAWVPLAFK